MSFKKPLSANQHADLLSREKNKVILDGSPAAQAFVTLVWLDVSWLKSWAITIKESYKQPTSRNWYHNYVQELDWILQAVDTKGKNIVSILNKETISEVWSFQIPVPESIAEYFKDWLTTQLNISHKRINWKHNETAKSLITILLTNQQVKNLREARSLSTHKEVKKRKYPISPEERAWLVEKVIAWKTWKTIRERWQERKKRKVKKEEDRKKNYGGTEKSKKEQIAAANETRRIRSRANEIKKIWIAVLWVYKIKKTLNFTENLSNDLSKNKNLYSTCIFFSLLHIYFSSEKSDKWTQDYLVHTPTTKTGFVNNQEYVQLLLDHSDKNKERREKTSKILSDLVHKKRDQTRLEHRWWRATFAQRVLTFKVKRNKLREKVDSDDDSTLNRLKEQEVSRKAHKKILQEKAKEKRDIMPQEDKDRIAK